MAPMTIVISPPMAAVLFSSMHFITLKTIVKLKQTASLWVWRVVCGTPYVSSIQKGQLKLSSYNFDQDLRCFSHLLWINVWYVFGFLFG